MDQYTSSGVQFYHVSKIKQHGWLIYSWWIINVDFPKSAVRCSWKRRTFVTRKRAEFTGAFLLRWRQWILIISPIHIRDGQVA
jgi:hypothetical protein